MGEIIEQSTPKSGRRGRPPAEAINGLIVEGTLSNNKLRCKFCDRVFPREKSLNAHHRTHTGTVTVIN